MEEVERKEKKAQKRSNFALSLFLFSTFDNSFSSHHHPPPAQLPFPTF